MKLSNFELEVMQIVWDEEQVIVPEVHQQIKQKRDVSYYTVKTIFDRLERKGAIQRLRTYGRTILYGPQIERHQMTTPLIKDFLKRMFGGQPLPMISHILAEEELSKEDITKLEQLVADKKKVMENEP